MASGETENNSIYCIPRGGSWYKENFESTPITFMKVTDIAFGWSDLPTNDIQLDRQANHYIRNVRVLTLFTFPIQVAQVVCQNSGAS